MSSALCDVWWVRYPRSHDGLLAVLDPIERDRLSRIRREDDRHRFVVGAALIRAVVAQDCGIEPSRVVVDRTCPDCGGPHGKPRCPDSGLQLSLSHSAARVVLASCHAGPLGVDVEGVDPDLAPGPLADSVISPRERLRDDAGTSRGFLRYWTRKEAVLKATGAGLRIPMTLLTVSPPDADPALIDCRADATLPRRVALLDLEAGPGHLASLALVDSGVPRVRERDGTALLRTLTPSAIAG